MVFINPDPLFLTKLPAGVRCQRNGRFQLGGITLWTFIEWLKQQEDVIVFNTDGKRVVQGVTPGAGIKCKAVLAVIDGMLFQD